MFANHLGLKREEVCAHCEVADDGAGVDTAGKDAAVHDAAVVVDGADDAVFVAGDVSAVAVTSAVAEAISAPGVAAVAVS